MSEYHKLQKEAAEARIGADRMAMGLPCLPDSLRGDMAEIERLRAALAAEPERCAKIVERLAEVGCIDGLYETDSGKEFYAGAVRAWELAVDAIRAGDRGGAVVMD